VDNSNAIPQMFKRQVRSISTLQSVQHYNMYWHWWQWNGSNDRTMLWFSCGTVALMVLVLFYW